MGGLGPIIEREFYYVGNLARYKNMGRALHFIEGPSYLYGEIAPHSKLRDEEKGVRTIEN